MKNAERVIRILFCYVIMIKCCDTFVIVNERLLSGEMCRVDEE